MRQQKKGREQHRAEWIDMSQRIEGDTSKLPSGVITKGMGDVAVCRLVEGDC